MKSFLQHNNKLTDKLPILANPEKDMESNIVEQLCRRKYRSFFVFFSLSTIVYIFYFSHFSLNPNDSSSSVSQFHQASLIFPDSVLEIDVASTQSLVYCNLPNLNPFHPSILKYIGKPNDVNCEKDYPTIFTTDLQSNLIQVVDPKIYGISDCCYRYLIRTNENDNAILSSGKCFPILNKITLIPVAHEFISVYCTKIHSPTKSAVTQIDMFGLVKLKPEVEQRIARQFSKSQYLTNALMAENVNDHATNSNPATFSAKKQNKLNVVILGLDAVSHMNFIRTMPKSYAFLTKNLSALGMSGYTKVGDNTFPNIVAALLGMNETELVNSCWPNTSKFFDSCPFIWKNFSQQGYRTSYAEDAPWMGIFNYGKRGFKNPPTDYYIRPLTYTQDRIIGTNNMLNAKICYGPRLAFKVLLDYVQKMAHTMQTHQKNYFQFIWATSLFHDFLNMGMLGDEILLTTLQWFQQKNYLNNTILALMSDHGIRWGDIRTTYQGKVEERMPLLFFVFPEWFKKTYEVAISNFKLNKNRLSTPYDLHETLKDILNLHNILPGNVSNRSKSLISKPSLPRGISLFLPIPLTRDCVKANIPEHWCVCHSMKPVPLQYNSVVFDAAKSVITQINTMFTSFPQCAPLKLSSVLNAQVLQIDNPVIRNSPSSANGDRKITLSITFVTFPSNGTFEATVDRNFRTSSSSYWNLAGDISRINLYGNQSKCVEDYNLKKYCYCL